MIVPNANPLGRRQVEQGYYCKRTDADGVDLNRNWGDEHRAEDNAGQDTENNPGPHGFSEPGTQILRDLIREYQPDVFLSVHSGAYLLGRPLGYEPEGAVTNGASMDAVLRPISERHCGGDCPVGGLASLLGYTARGCDIDYVSQEMGVQFA